MSSAPPSTEPIEPTPAQRYLAMGWKLHQEKKWHEAERAYRSALKLDQHDADVLCHLGMVCHDLFRFEEAIALYDRALKIRPEFVEVLNNLGNSLMRRGELDRSIECFRKAISLRPDFAEAHMHMGVVLLMRGEFPEGWKEYAWRFSTKMLRLPDLVQKVWDGSSLDGKTIVLGAEQGLGDTIQFVRYAQRLKEKYPSCRVLVACQRKLGEVLQGCPGVDELVLSDPAPKFDEYAPLLSLPGIFNDDVSTFPSYVPYLQPEPQRVEAWGRHFEATPEFKIGLVWQGNPDNPADQRRSMKLASFMPLAALAGVKFYSLQKGPGEEQVEEFRGRMNVEALGPYLDVRTGAFVDTAAVLKNLDLLITVDTSVAHVAGAMGIPTWLLLPTAPDWRWQMEGDTTPWYPSMQLFRQREIGDWEEVVTRIGMELVKNFPKRIRLKLPGEYRLASTGDNRVISVPERLYLCDHRDAVFGRAIENYGEFCAGETDLIFQLVKTGQVVAEHGAKSGVNTLAFSEAVGEAGWVLAWEGCRESFQMLNAQAALNSRVNIQSFWGELGAEAGEVERFAVQYARRGETDRIPMRTLDSYNLPKLDFLRLAEGDAAPAVWQGADATIGAYKPIVLSAVPTQPAERAKLIERMQRAGYEAYWHVPPLFRTENTFGNPQNTFGNAASVNILGIHKSRKTAINGLPKIASPHEDWKAAVKALAASAR